MAERKRVLLQFVYGKNTYRICNYKTICIISGLRRSGKSTFVRSIIGASISSEIVDGFDIKAQNGVELIDTEMAQDLAQELESQTLQMSGVDRDVFDKRYNYTNLVHLNTPKLKFEEVKNIIAKTDKDIIIVDNLSGLASDQNSQTEASKIKNELNALIFEHNKLLIVVAHNAMSGSVYGVVGKGLLDIASAAFSFRRSDMGYTLVEQVKERYDLMPTFDFSLDDDKNVIFGPYLPFPTMNLEVD